jgi:von Willebrand factor type A C-terminal domain/von Willebrand factor type A domain
MTEFGIEAFFQEHLPAGGRSVDAIVEVSGRGDHMGPLAPTEVVIVVDASGSMQERRKMAQAKKAVDAAIDCLHDGTRFAVVVGREAASPAYPAQGLAPADAATRAAAHQKIKRLSAGGGTRIGEWLLFVSRLFSTTPGTVRRVILLTDGQNGEAPGVLERALKWCEGRFECDCRGVGTDWDVDELRKIATALLGTIDIIPTAEHLNAEFTALAARAMSLATADVWLEIWTPASGSVRFLRQVSPSIDDLTPRAVRMSDRVHWFPLGSWGAETREYHLGVDVPAGDVGDELLAARASVVVSDAHRSTTQIRVGWTDDLALSTTIHPAVAHYTGQAELASAIQKGLDARRTGDEVGARSQLGRAVQLAATAGHTDTLALLGRVVDIDDAATGSVRLRGTVADVDEMTLDTRSTMTVRRRTGSPGG